MASQESPQLYLPRWNQWRFNSGGNYGSSGNAMSSLGGDIASAIAMFADARDRRKQDDLANALMNNGQAPGADPFVRAAVYPDGDQGDDPGPVPFAHTDTPYDGGQQQMGLLGALQAYKDKQGNTDGANALAYERLRSSKQPTVYQQHLIDKDQYYQDHPEAVPQGGRKQFSPRKSNALPQPSGGRANGNGVDPLPDDAPPALDSGTTDAAPAAGPTPSFGERAKAGVAASGGLLGALGAMFPFGGHNSKDGVAMKAETGMMSTAQPGSEPSATPLVAQGGIPTVNSREEAMKLPSGTKFRGPDGKIRIVP